MDGSNGYDRATLERLLGDIDAADSELASLKGEYMQSCRAPREDIAAVFERAKEAGIRLPSYLLDSVSDCQNLV